MERTYQTKRQTRKNGKVNYFQYNSIVNVTPIKAQPLAKIPMYRICSNFQGIIFCWGEIFVVKGTYENLLSMKILTLL